MFNITLTTHNDQEIYVLGVKEFAVLLGCSIDDISDECKEYIINTDFRYRKLSCEERENIILETLLRIESGELSESGPHRKPDWEEGWQENLTEFVNNDFNLKYLIPKFVRRNAVMRLCGEYIMPFNTDFEVACVNVLRKVLFGRYFSEARSIFEFGCGTGLNLVELAALFPEKRLFGFDWAKTSCEIVSKIAELKNLRMESGLFDMYNPDYELNLTASDAVFTVGAMEQLGTNYIAFLNFLLKKKPLICINIETTNEIYTNKTLSDYAAIKYTKKRNYLFGYLKTLISLEKRGDIKILQEQRTFGGLYHEGYSFVVWKPF